MKKLLFLFALGTVTPTLKPSFAQALAPANPAPVPEAAPFQWQLHLQAGQKFLTTTDTSSESSQQMPQMPGTPQAGAQLSMNNKTQSHMVIEQNVLSSDDKGARVEVVYRDITQSSVMRQGDKVIYDSAHPPDALKNSADPLKGMVGARISFQISPQGQVSDIQGAKEYLDHLNQGQNKAFGQTPEGKAQQKTMREAMVSPEALQELFGAVYRSMPSAPIAPGGSWKYLAVTPLMGTTFTHKGQGTFVSRTGGIVSIAQKGELATDGGAEFKVPVVLPGNAQTPAPISQLDLHGTSISDMTVDEASGLTLQSHTTQSMEGDLVMYGLTGVGSQLTIPMKMKVETTSQTQEVKAKP